MNFKLKDELNNLKICLRVFTSVSNRTFNQWIAIGIQPDDQG